MYQLSYQPEREESDLVGSGLAIQLRCREH